MRDLGILAIVLASVALAFHRPWLGLLALTVFGYMHPQGYATGFMREFPAYKVLFAAVVIALLVRRSWRPLPFDWRLIVLATLWAFFLFTTVEAMVPWAAWARFAEVSKIFLSLGLALLLIDTRRKLFLFIVTIATSFALVTIKGGYWAVMTGFSDRVYGPPGSQFSDNNLFAVAVIMTLPLLVVWLRETPNPWMRYGLMATIGLSGAAALSSWSRGAVVTLVVTGVVLLWHSRRKYATVPLVVAAIAIAWVSLPQGWFARMQEAIAYGQDPSAQGRLDVWRIGIKTALEFPLTGVGLDGWQYAVVTMDWHSSYVEMMAEHGFVGFGLWCLLLFGTITSLFRLAYRIRATPELGWVRSYANMLAVSLIAYGAGSLFLGLSYWDFFYQLVVVAVLLGEMARKVEKPLANEPRLTAAGGPIALGQSSAL